MRRVLRDIRAVAAAVLSAMSRQRNLSLPLSKSPIPPTEDQISFPPVNAKLLPSMLIMFSGSSFSPFGINGGFPMKKIGIFLRADIRIGGHELLGR